MNTILIIVSGQVQGVFYRQSAREKAQQLGIGGTVRNLPDGRVKIIATGTKVQLDSFLNWCRQGPARARVTGLTTEASELQLFEGFSIIR